MTTSNRKSRKDFHALEREPDLENLKPYTTSEILQKLKDDPYAVCFMSEEQLAEHNNWINKFKTYPEIIFHLNLDETYVAECLTKNRKMIETIVNPKKRRGPKLLPNNRLRLKRVSVYVSDEELEKLENTATLENRSVTSLLREKGLGHKFSEKPSKLDLQAYSELSRSASNLNQIAKHLNSHPEAIIDLDKIRAVLSEFRYSLIGVNKNENTHEE